MSRCGKIIQTTEWFWDIGGLPLQAHYSFSLEVSPMLVSSTFLARWSVNFWKCGLGLGSYAWAWALGLSLSSVLLQYICEIYIYFYFSTGIVLHINVTLCPHALRAFPDLQPPSQASISCGAISIGCSRYSYSSCYFTVLLLLCSVVDSS